MLKAISPVLHVAVTAIFHSGIQKLVKLASYKRIVNLKLSLPCPQKPSKGQPQIQKHFFSSKVGYKLNSSKIVVYMTDLSGSIWTFEAIARKRTAEMAQSRFIASSSFSFLFLVFIPVCDLPPCFSQTAFISSFIHLPFIRHVCENLKVW